MSPYAIQLFLDSFGRRAKVAAQHMGKKRGRNLRRSAQLNRRPRVPPRTPEPKTQPPAAMRNYPPTQQSQRTLSHALAKLIEHTARRVRDGIRSPWTLRMQAVHAKWMEQVRLPVELAAKLGAAVLGDVPIAAFTTPTLVDLIEHFRTAGGVGGRPLSLNSTAKRKCTLGRALRIAVERGELASLPLMPEIGMPPLRPRLRILRDYAELQVVLAALPLRRAEWVSVAIWTCQRPGDVERMTWADVDLEATPPAMIIRSTKTRRPHGIRAKVPRTLVQTLQARFSRLQEAGKPPAPSDPLVDPWPNVSRVLPLVCVRNGLPPLSALDLRHTGFSWMVRRIGITRAAQEWGGWSDFSMISRYYAHALPAGLEHASDELASIVDDDTGRRS